MAESLFTSQTPAVTDASDGTPGITAATSLTFAGDGEVTGIRFYATATVSSATYTAELWQQTSPDNVSATGTRVGVKEVTITPTAGTWNTITFDSPVPVTAGTMYRAAVHNPARYVATNGFFTSSGLTNGNITAPQASAATRNGTFRIGAAANVYPTTSPADACYFVDAVFEVGGSTITGTGVAELGALTATAIGTTLTPAGSSATVSASDTSSSTVTAGRTSSATATATRTSSSTVTGG